MASTCSSTPCAHKLLVDERDDELLRVKARNYDMQCEIERLKKGEESRVHDMQREMDSVKKQLEEARAELKETQAVLGQAFVSGNVGKRNVSLTEADADKKPIPLPVKAVEDIEKTFKRNRSPSIEIIEPPVSFRNKPANQKAFNTPQLAVLKKELTVVSKPGQVPISSWVNEEEIGRLAKRQKLQADPEEPETKAVAAVNTSANRRALEQASAEAGASLTWKENHNAVTAIAAPPPGVKNDPAPGDMRQHGPGDESSRTAAPQLPAVVKTSPNTSKSSSAPVASSSTTKTVKSERKPGGSATALTLPLSVAETYLVSSTPLTINPPPLKLEVPRKFLRVAYGGSDQHFLQYIPAETNPSGPGRRCIMFPTLALNPLMPSTPGMHGLVFASRREILNSGTWTVFCKRSNAKPAVWLYVGEYENTLAGTMKAEEFNQQTLLVQREWATQLMDCKLHDCYVSMRARIALRKAGQLPVTGQMGEAKAAEEDRRVNDEIIAVKNNRGLPVNKEDIIEAFCKGEEAIDVIRMRCVAYDHVFAEDMRAKYPNYPALEAASKKKKTPKITAASGKTRKAKGRISRRKTISVASESDEDTTESDEEYAGSGDDFVGPPPSDIRHSTLNRDLRSRLAA